MQRIIELITFAEYIHNASCHCESVCDCETGYNLDDISKEVECASDNDILSAIDHVSKSQNIDIFIKIATSPKMLRRSSIHEVRSIAEKHIFQNGVDFCDQVINKL